MVRFTYGITFHGKLVVGLSGTLDRKFCEAHIRDREALFWRVVPLPFTCELSQHNDNGDYTEYEDEIPFGQAEF